MVDGDVEEAVLCIGVHPHFAQTQDRYQLVCQEAEKSESKTIIQSFE